MRGRTSKTACSERLSFERAGRTGHQAAPVASAWQAPWASSLPGSLGSLLAPLLASYLARNGEGMPGGEKVRGAWSTGEHLELCSSRGGSHSSVSATSLHLLVFLSSLTRESKHRLRCLIHNESYGTNMSFHGIEGQSLKSAIERNSRKRLRGLGALGFGP